MKTFQYILLFIFAILAIIGVVVFARFGGFGGGETIGKVVIWGTLKEEVMDEFLYQTRLGRTDLEGISYVEKDPATYHDEFVDALASGRGPDLIMLSGDDVVREKDKVIPISYKTLSRRSFSERYVEGAEIFLSEDGIDGLPFLIDPLVMYVNRNILSREGIAKPPGFWDEVLTLSPKLTTLDQNRTITQSAIALGEFLNIAYAKEIFASLMFQVGNHMVGFAPDGALTSTLLHNSSSSLDPGVSVLRFYTEFANPQKGTYSWNRSLPEAKRAFLAEDLAFYVGFASEAPEIRADNPNLNFVPVLLPQAGEGALKRTYARIVALAVTRWSQNQGGAYALAQILTSDSSLERLSSFTGLPPISRALLSAPPPDVWGDVFYESALVGFSWRDPNPEASDGIFKRMIENVTSGRSSLIEAVSRASEELEVLLKKR